MKAPKELAEQAAQAFTDALSEHSSTWLNRKRYEDKCNVFGTYSEDTVRAIIAMSSTPELYWNLEMFMDGNGYEKLVSDYAHLCAVMERYGFQEEGAIRKLVHALRWYDFAPVDTEGGRSKWFEQASAIIRLTGACIDESGMDTVLDDLLEYEVQSGLEFFVPIIQDQELLAMITKGDYAPALIAEVVVTRQVTDVRVITAMLENNHSSLLEGAL